MVNIIGAKYEHSRHFEYTLDCVNDTLELFWSLTLKTYIKLSKVLLLLILFVVGCSGLPTKATQEQNTCISNTLTMDDFISKINDQKTKSPGSKIYTFFVANKCKDCPLLEDAVQKMSLDGEVIFLNIELTWAFLISHRLGIRGVPSMVVFVNSEPIIGQTGANNILQVLNNIRGR